MKIQLGGKPKYRMRSCKSSRGLGLVEAAFMLGLLLLLTFAVVDFSSVLYVYLSLENGVSQATRYAVIGQVQDNPITPLVDERAESIKNAMRQAAPTLDIQNKATFTFQRWNGSGWVSGTGGPNDVIRVTVNYNWQYITPLLRPFFSGGLITLSASSTMKNEPFLTSGS